MQMPMMSADSGMEMLGMLADIKIIYEILNPLDEREPRLF